jgi:hypothetical protein
LTYVPKSNIADDPGLLAVAPGILMLIVALSVPYRMQNLLTKCAPEKLAHCQVHATRQGTGAEVTHDAHRGGLTLSSAAPRQHSAAWVGSPLSQGDRDRGGGRPSPGWMQVPLCRTGLRQPSLRLWW